MLVVMLLAYALVGTFATTGIFGKVCGAVHGQYMGSTCGASALHCATQMGPSYFILRCTLWSHPAGPIRTPPFPRTLHTPGPSSQVLTNLYLCTCPPPLPPIRCSPTCTPVHALPSLSGAHQVVLPDPPPYQVIIKLYFRPPPLPGAHQPVLPHPGPRG